MGEECREHLPSPDAGNDRGHADYLLQEAGGRPFGTQTTSIGAEWDDPILELSAYKMFQFLHEYDKAKACRESFLEMAVGLADIYHLEEIDRDSHLGPSSAYMPR